MKNKVEKLDVDKLLSVPVDLSKLNDVAKNDVTKKDVYNAKIKYIEDKIPDITNLATNTTLNAKINDTKNEARSITNLLTKISLNAKINEIKNKIPNITNLATNTALTDVENKMLDYGKCIATPEFNNLTAKSFAARLKQEYLATKCDYTVFVKKTDFDYKL